MPEKELLLAVLKILHQKEEVEGKEVWEKKKKYQKHLKENLKLDWPGGTKGQELETAGKNFVGSWEELKFVVRLRRKLKVTCDTKEVVDEEEDYFVF